MIIRRFSLVTTAIRTLVFARRAHSGAPIQPIPSPTPFVPDVQTFLSLIGRSLSQHASKIPSWDALFTLTSRQFQELGIEPSRNRKYLLAWLQRFRDGEFGIGGDCTEVKDGVAELRLVEVPIPPSEMEAYENQQPGKPFATATLSPGMRRIVINVPNGTLANATPTPDEWLQDAKHVRGIKVFGEGKFKGKNVKMYKGTDGKGASLQVREGLWEIKKSKKLDGGERRRAEVRAKRRIAEKNAGKAPSPAASA